MVTSILSDLIQCPVSALVQKNACNMQCHKTALYEIKNSLYVFLVFFPKHTMKGTVDCDQNLLFLGEFSNTSKSFYWNWDWKLKTNSRSHVLLKVIQDETFSNIHVSFPTQASLLSISSRKGREKKKDLKAESAQHSNISLSSKISYIHIIHSRGREECSQPPYVQRVPSNLLIALQVEDNFWQFRFGFHRFHWTFACISYLFSPVLFLTEHCSRIRLRFGEKRCFDVSGSRHLQQFSLICVSRRERLCITKASEG